MVSRKYNSLTVDETAKGLTAAVSEIEQWVSVILSPDLLSILSPCVKPCVIGITVPAAPQVVNA
jgi:hypothetical protein